MAVWVVAAASAFMPPGASIGQVEYGPAGETVLKRIFSEEQLTDVCSQLDAIDAANLDIKEGDRYALVYQPGVGTALFHNGNQSSPCRMPGSPAPTSPSGWGPTRCRGLRDELLGG